MQLLVLPEQLYPREQLISVHIQVVFPWSVFIVHTLKLIVMATHTVHVTVFFLITL